MNPAPPEPTQKLARRLLGFTALQAALLVALAVATLSIVAWMRERDEMVRNGQTIARIVAGDVAAAVMFDDAFSARRSLSALQSFPEVLDATVRLPDGRPFADLHAEASSQHDHVVPHEDTHFHGGQLHLTVPIAQSGEALGFLHLMLDMRTAHARMAGYVAAIVGTALLGLAIIIGTQRWLLGRMLQPLSDLLQAMQRVGASGRYEERVTVKSRTEVGQLGRMFNSMMDQIQQRDLDLAAELRERRRVERELEHLAFHDMVTELPNRHYLRMRGQALVKADGSTGTAIVYLDIDAFQQVNDNFGHDCGDEVLMATARRLRHALRTDDVLARFGGDEFVVVLQRVRDEQDALTVARKLLDVLALPIHVRGHEFIIEATAGVSMAPHHGSSFDELLKNADSAMSMAKQHGRHTAVLWNTAISQKSRERFNLQADLRLALEAGQIQCDYQPIVRLADGCIVGMEALARWEHPRRGRISPAEFIPLAEDTGLIVPMGLQVMERACAQVRQWHDEFGPLFVAVNVSARQFREGDLARDCLAVCRRTGLPVSQLELEVTESAVMTDRRRALQVMKGLVEQGMRLSLDDFGTGHSSLAYLRRFPISKLKIDRSFVKNLPEDEDGLSIVNAIVALGKSLKVSVVAEGIETAAQDEALRAAGCDFGQGYLYGRPLGAKDFAQLLASQRQAG